MRIVFATGNQNKMREIHEIMDDLGMEIVSMKEAGISADIVEDGTSFEENAVIKASAIARQCEDIVLADDSGLEIDALDRKPGVYSARWLGHDTPYDVKNEQVLDMLKDVKDRTCRYVCAIAVTRPGNKPVVFEDSVECVVAPEARGTNGFGYDPIILYEPMGKTMAEMSRDEKNSISHRGKAVRKFEKWLNETDTH